MSGESKTTLNEIVAGDEVAYHTISTYPVPMHREVVTGVTPTQIVIGELRFYKSDGRARSDWKRDRIYPLGAQRDGIPYAQFIEQQQAEMNEVDRRYKFIDFINGQSARTLARNFDSATLEQAAKLLGYQEEPRS